MTKVYKGIVVTVFLTVLWATALAQQFTVIYLPIDRDSTFIFSQLQLQRTFVADTQAKSYIAKLVPVLKSKGFISASIDAISYDSTTATVSLFVGKQYRFDHIQTYARDERVLSEIGWSSNALDFDKLEKQQQRILNWLDNNGHPFGKVYLENIVFDSGKLSAWLHIDRGPEYFIDSIRVYGDVSLNKNFLQQYLELPNHSLYNKDKLAVVGKKLAQLGFVIEDRPSEVSFLGTGAVLNLYLRQRQASSVNALVGFLPSTDINFKRKLLLAVDANVLLKNAFGNGETIGLLWQQLQQQSPRLDLRYEHPYVFHSPLNAQFSFDMFKQDTSFVNISMKLGAGWNVNFAQQASVFLQRRQTIVNGFNPAAVIQTKQLPEALDVSSVDLGVGLMYNQTDYRMNPRKGLLIEFSGAAGQKKIKRNNLVTELKDPTNPAFQFSTLYDQISLSAFQLRLNGKAQQFFPLGSQTTFLLAANGGMYQSASYYKNELFRIGGYKLLRGFNDESQYVSQYLIGTAEFRYLVGLNSAFFVFVDGGAGKHTLEQKKYHQYISSGLGLNFETKAGIIQLAWAVGKRDDSVLDLKQSKIHIGFASYF